MATIAENTPNYFIREKLNLANEYYFKQRLS